MLKFDEGTDQREWKIDVNDAEWRLTETNLAIVDKLVWTPKNAPVRYCPNSDPLTLMLLLMFTD